MSKSNKKSSYENKIQGVGTNVYRNETKATFNLHYNILMEWIGLINDLINNE